MADATKDVSGGGGLISDLKSLFPLFRTRRTVVFAYGFMFTFLAFTLFIAFNPSATSSPWFTNIFGSRSSDSSYRSQFSSLFSYFLPNSSRPFYSSTQNTLFPPDLKVFNTTTTPHVLQTAKNGSEIATPVDKKGSLKNGTETSSGNVNSQPVSASLQSSKKDDLPKNGTMSRLNGSAKKNGTMSGLNGSAKATPKSPPADKKSVLKNKTEDSNGKTQAQAGNQTVSASSQSTGKKDPSKNGNLTASLLKKEDGSSPGLSSGKQVISSLLRSMMHCNIFDGRWVKDDSYPLYPPGSCPHIDEPFDCFLNGRPDQAYQKLRWQPKNCNIPRLNGREMLELLRGKRLVYVGDSLNRNMWESLVCILRNSVEDKSRVFEASGRREFRTAGSYSFLFEDYNCSVEFFRSPFLVQEWEIPDTNGSKKETLRLDLVERSSDKYKNADIVVFNTGHWWTHEKTSLGKGYYQEGSHIYDELNVVEAFRRAVTTWARWVDANVDSKKTLVFFRGYSASHFSGGQWNSGGQCDHETEPIRNETYLSAYPQKMTVLESVIKWMKTPISYLNITRMTDYRKDAHPSIYRKQYFSEEERRSPLRYQDCSHWCLPGVPDSWNELLYAQLLIKYNQEQQQKQQLLQQKQKG